MTIDTGYAQAEVLVAGKNVSLGEPPACAHRSFVEQVIVADLHDEETHEHARWEARVKVRCGECGVPFVFKTDEVRASADGRTAGITIEPGEPDPADAAWATPPTE